MLIPRKVKHRKQHSPKRHGAAKGGTKVNFGDYGIQALEPAYVTNRQIESARIAINRHIRRGGKVWIYKGEVVGGRRQHDARDNATQERAPRRERPNRPRRSGASGTTATSTEAGRAAAEAAQAPSEPVNNGTPEATAGNGEG